MKNYSPALVNSGKPKFSFKTFFLGSAAAQTYYYCARHKTEDIYIMWIESTRFGNTFCFPCVLDEQGDAMVYLPGRGLQNKTKNAAMVQRWNLFAKPATFMDEFHFHAVPAPEFHEEYGKYKHTATGGVLETAPPAQEHTEALPQGEPQAQAQESQADSAE